MAAARFWEQVETGPMLSPYLGPCLLWTGPKRGRGYGGVTVDGAKEYVHRVACELVKGPIPPEHDVDHLCRTLLCMAPAHLEAVTHRENCLRGTSISAVNARKIACIRGHAFDEANTRLERDGKRKCRRCDAMRTKARELRLRAA